MMGVSKLNEPEGLAREDVEVQRQARLRECGDELALPILTPLV
jgi:hypothetical protein